MFDFRRLVRDRLPRLAVTPEREAEIVNELALQMEQSYQNALTAGASDEEALRRARLQFPDWTALAQEINAAERPPERTASGSAGAGLWNDFRYAARLLRRNPGFAAGAILTLALGMGANTAIFSVADALVLRSLPYEDPDRLMAIETHQPRQSEIEPWTSALDFSDLRENNQAFTAVAGISPVWNVVLSGRGDAERLEALYVSASFFPMLGVKPPLGRTFFPSEDVGSKPANMVVLSDSFWRRKFGADRSAIGQLLNLGGTAYTILGVLPAEFRYLGEPVAGGTAEIDLWMPLSDNQLAGSPRSLRFLKVIGRRKEGISPQQANADLQRLGASLAARYPDTNRGFEIGAQPLSDTITGRLRPTMFLLLGAVGLVLLLACANVANLLLARATTRMKEISVRVALGASGFRLARQLLVEGLLLATVGGLTGLALASAALEAFRAFGPAALVHSHALTVDARALWFTSAIVLASAFLAGLPPAWRLLRSSIADALRESGRGMTPSSHRLRSALVAGEIALALTLLTGAGLLIHSFVKLLEVDPGFDARNLVTLTTQMPASATTPPQLKAIYTAIRERLLATPGVSGVGAVTRLPLMGSNLGSWLTIEGRVATGGEAPQVEFRRASGDYFATMGIPLRSGRNFDERDNDAGALPVVLINETLARKHFPGEDPVGKRIKLGGSAQGPWISIIGVVGSVRHFALETEPRPEAYAPVGTNPLFSPIFTIRTKGDPAALIPSLMAAVRVANAECPVYNVFRMEDLVARSAGQRRFVVILLAVFAGLALALAAVGVYGIVAQSVAQRTAEIGLRMALGSTPAGALRLVFGDGLKLTVAGVAAGLLGAAGVARAMKSLLFSIQPLDPLAFTLAALALIALASAACLIPAWRATRIDPVVALRSE